MCDYRFRRGIVLVVSLFGLNISIFAGNVQLRPGEDRYVATDTWVSCLEPEAHRAPIFPVRKKCAYGYVGNGRVGTDTYLYDGVSRGNTTVYVLLFEWMHAKSGQMRNEWVTFSYAGCDEVLKTRIRSCQIGSATRYYYCDPHFAPRKNLWAISYRWINSEGKSQMDRPGSDRYTEPDLVSHDAVGYRFGSREECETALEQVVSLCPR